MRGFWSTLHNSAFYTPHQVHNMRPPMTILHYAMPCYAMPFRALHRCDGSEVVEVVASACI